MGLFSVQRRPRYRQENAMGNANAMASLLGMKAEQMNGISTAVDNYGQSRTRGELATLMGQEEYAGLTPEQAQAKIFGLTKGRDLGKSGEFMMTSSLGNKEDIQANQMKQDAASLLFNRQNSQIAQRHSNALSRAKSGESGVAGLTGNNASKAKEAYMQMMSQTTDPKERLKIAQEAFFNGVLNKNDRIGMEKLGLIPATTSTSSKPDMTGIPSAMKTILSKNQLAGLARGKASGQVKLVDVNKGKKTNNGNQMKPRFEMRSISGHPINPSDLIKFQ